MTAIISIGFKTEAFVSGGGTIPAFSDTDDVVLEISDDGDGFHIPPDLEELKVGGHFGVVGMRERAERVGGQLELESAPGKGCRLRVVVPALTPAGRGSAR